MNASNHKSGISWNSVGLISGLLVLVFLLATMLPNFVDLRGNPKIRARHACKANLKTIEGAKATWALDNNRVSNAMPTDTDLFGMANYIREKPACPLGGTYTTGQVGEKPRCSIPGHTI